MFLYRKWIVGSILLSLLALFAFFSLLASTAASSLQGNQLIYVPIAPVQRPPWGIYGRITENGVPVPDITINLRLHDGLDWTTVATTTTDDNARYHFFDMPALPPGHTYNVLYLNLDNKPNRVGAWIGYLITDYAAGAEVAGANIDITDAQPAGPPSGAQVTLPATFTWQPRAIPTDSYEFELFADGGIPYFYSNPALGYTDTYTLNTLPPGFQFDTPYSWSLVIYGPGGGGETGNYGFSGWGHNVTFVKPPSGPLFIPLLHTLIPTPLPR